MAGQIIKELRVNQRIRSRECLLIGENGEQLGIMLIPQALQKAREANLDLVEMSPTAVPPVCKLLDYGRFKYEQTKKEHKARKGQRGDLLKEMRLRPRIKEHDLDSKIKLIKKFLNEGDKVKISLVFRGREASHPERGWVILKKLTDDLKDDGVLVGSPTKEGSNINITFLPHHQNKPKETELSKEGKETSNAKA